MNNPLQEMTELRLNKLPQMKHSAEPKTKMKILCGMKKCGALRGTCSRSKTSFSPECLPSLTEQGVMKTILLNLETKMMKNLVPSRCLLSNIVQGM